MKNQLLAPNGKPSNLNATQYELVRTPEFKKWFGDWERLVLTKLFDSGIDDVTLKRLEDSVSKVVDSNGEPMVVWHTTSSEFNVFNKKKSKDGFFFSPQKQRLSVYGKSNINSYFLNLRNPSHEIFKSDLKYLLTKGYDGIMDYGYAKHLGNENLYEIVAFEPNQIKLADGTNTNFDSGSDDIRFEQGGELKNIISQKFDEGYGKVKYFKLNQYGGNWEYVKNPDFSASQLKKSPTYVIETDKETINKAMVIRNEYESKQPKEISILDFAQKFANANNGKIYHKSKSGSVYVDVDNKQIRISDHYILDRDAMNPKLRYDLEIVQRYYDENTPIDLSYWNNSNDVEIEFEKGGRTIAQTPAPKKERVYGSALNKEKTSTSVSSARMIKFDEKTIQKIKNKINEHNEEYPDKKINLASAKAVVRRGMGAYSKSHRPTISGGRPNSRVAWGLARLNAFAYKIVNGKSKSGRYNQDDDLIEELGFEVANYQNGGEMKKDIRCINCGWEWNKKDSELWDMYVCHKCGFDNSSFYTSDPINKLFKGGRFNSVKGYSPNYLKMFLGK